MSKRIPVHQDGKEIYDILLRHDFSDLPDELTKLGFSGRRFLIVTDSNVAPLYLCACKEAVSSVSSSVAEFIMPAGEENKTLDVVRDLYEQLILAHFDRKDVLIALGGGVVGDLTGFTAATYLRGIDFIQIPTTLLAQVDSSIGGKTGVDFDRYKNMVGAFLMPHLVYMNLSVLNSLPERIYLSGFGEIVKHGLIRDAGYVAFLNEHREDLLNRDPEVLEETIRVSCEIKRSFVEEDPTEKGIRAVLNFGHTFGHAIEKEEAFSLLHGECVSVGCVAAAAVSKNRGLITESDFGMIRETFLSLKLPVSVEGLFADDLLFDMKSDKKRDAGSIRFVLLDRIGHAFTDTTVTEEEIRAGLREVGVTAS